jgi:thioester reductase-like protein
LVRADDHSRAVARAQDVLASIGRDLSELWDRIHVICGSVTSPDFGLPKYDYDRLGERVDLIMHGAAEVNWTWSYRRLRHINVGGTLEALRFASCRRTKQIGFVSSIAARFVSDGPPLVTETTPMLPHLAQMPLGYAQTKCVSEALLEQAAERGLPVTVMRASLLTGDTQSGVCAINDLMTALLEACVRKRHALDIDGLFDCIPVDYAARAFARLVLSNIGRFERFQLRACRPRHWREIVLWLNLAGYDVAMEAVDSWLDRQFGRPDVRIERMRPFRRFFLGLPGPVPKHASLCQDSHQTTRRNGPAASQDSECAVVLA